MPLCVQLGLLVSHSATGPLTLDCCGYNCSFNCDHDHHLDLSLDPHSIRRASLVQHNGLVSPHEHRLQFTEMPGRLNRVRYRGVLLPCWTILAQATRTVLDEATAIGLLAGYPATLVYAVSSSAYRDFWRFQRVICIHSRGMGLSFGEERFDWDFCKSCH